jgi:RHS repeat-associated protein
MGKVGQNLGDLLAGFDPDPTQAQIDGLVAKPRKPSSNPAESEVTQIVRDLLQNATTRIVYDLDRFRRLGQPPFAATIAREKHVSDLVDGEQSKLQVSFSYSDGFGREIQKKIQAEPGPTSEGGPITNPRWVGSGWTIFNNKGKPVRRYEPFFSSTHQFEFAKIAGVSPIFFYDPMGRAVATLHPNHTYEKVAFDPWRQKAYDVNDTVALDPRTDPDIAGQVKHYFAAQPASWQTWRELRKNGQMGAGEKDAAEKTFVHADTPTVTHLDTLGRGFLTVAHNRFERNGAIVDEKYATRALLDIEGNQREVRDAKDRAVMRYDYNMLGARIHQVGMEAGERWILNDITGKPIRAWDSRRFIRRMTYDALRRPTGLFVTENGAELQAERTVYGESLGDSANHRTRAHQVFDGAGVVTSEAYDFKGNLLRSKRELLPDYKQAVNWLQNPLPNDGTLISSASYDALNRKLAVTTPDGSVYRPTFNEANLLDRISLELRGGAVTPFVTNIDYNARGQRKLITYANGAQTNYGYDPLTFRLTKLITTRPANPDGAASQLFNSVSLMQDLRYNYDPVGNITRIEDAALKTVVHDQEEVDPVGEYRYDAIYRLIEAKGREHIGQAAIDFDLPNNNRRDRDYPFFGLRDHSNDAQAMRNYTERYEYDEVGNFKFLRHIFKNGSWIRSYDYQEASLLEPATHMSNRLTATAVGNGGVFPETYTYTDANGADVHGCTTSINAMKMVWDFKDQLQQVDLGGGGAAYYVYDAGGQRVRKVIETQGGARKEERIYLGGYEIYRKYSGGANVELERETLNVMDDKQRIALVETMRIENGNAINALAPLQRYQLGNHLRSASLELDADGALISYEEYHPYGTTSFQAGRDAAEISMKRYRYTGKERDEESGLYYYGARYYSPWLGRWMSCDPIGIGDGVNVYAYVANRPMNHLDPDGRANEPIHEHLTTLVAMQYVDLGTARQIGEAANAPDVLDSMDSFENSFWGDPDNVNKNVHVLGSGTRQQKVDDTIARYKARNPSANDPNPIWDAGIRLLHPIQDASYHGQSFGRGLGHLLSPESDLAVGDKTFKQFLQVVKDTEKGLDQMSAKGIISPRDKSKTFSERQWMTIYNNLKSIESCYQVTFGVFSLFEMGGRLTAPLAGLIGGGIGAVLGGIVGASIALFSGDKVSKGLARGAEIGFVLGQAWLGGLTAIFGGLLMPLAKDWLRTKVAAKESSYLKEEQRRIAKADEEKTLEMIKAREQKKE